MKTTIKLAMVGIILLTACKKNGHGVTTSLEPTTSSASSSLRPLINGQNDLVLVYYNTILVQMKLIQFKERPSASLLAHNQSINILYMDRANGFVTVADAIQGDSYSAIWKEVDIVFNPGFPPHQFYSDAEIIAAATNRHPEIVLLPTNNIYRGAIIEHTKVQ